MMEKLSSKSSSITKNFARMESTIAKMIPLYLGFENNVYMIGIHGMGGLGKTTLARILYDEFHIHFEGSSFIANIREDSQKHGLPRLQKQLLVDILKDKEINIQNVYEGVDMIKKRLCHKKVLLVIDDVNYLDQLEKLVGEKNWFGLGSWIIITTRDERVLIQHGVLRRYKPEVLNNDDALKLFCLKAFKMEQPKEGYMQLSQKVVEYANGLPLALVTLGSFLVERTIDEWQSTLNNFKETKGEIYDILKISYDGLEEMWKEIFLDITCFFRGYTKDEVLEMLKNRGFDAKIGLSVLVEKSLITMDDNEHLGMHDLLQEMGQKIVRLKSGGNLGKQSRLWLSEDLLCVLKNNMATNAIQAIVVNCKEEDCSYGEFSEVFSKMSNLRLLSICHLHSKNTLNRDPNELRYLERECYSLKCLPSGLPPKELVQLDLKYSRIKYLWEGVKILGKLKSLANLPSISAKIESLTVLNLNGCSNLRMIPEFKGIMKSLSELRISCTAIEELPPTSMKCLSSLKYLTLSGINFVTLPVSISQLSNLEALDFSHCLKLRSVPELAASVRYIKAEGCTSLEPSPALL
ncbi:disease resistance protein Roq1-like [Quercus robur]|uniref:disease resistance protein Roq1-like n=1 Tax=Quercus robur TaxID=38942 RepID=UPI002161731C|nr:disease resistance protein Roq1-like [Quercus robur]